MPDPQEGTTDNPYSLYPEIETVTVSIAPYQVERKTSFQAPIAQMNNLSIRSPLQINTAITRVWATQTWHAPIQCTMEHDFYSDRFALSPKERPTMFAGNHYSDVLALSPVESEDEGNDHFALSDNEGVKKRQARAVPRRIKEKKADSLPTVMETEEKESQAIPISKEKEEKRSDPLPISKRKRKEEKKPKTLPIPQKWQAKEYPLTRAQAGKEKEEIARSLAGLETSESRALGAKLKRPRR